MSEHVVQTTYTKCVNFLLLDEEGMGSNIKLCSDQERKAKLFRVSHAHEATGNTQTFLCRESTENL